MIDVNLETLNVLLGNRFQIPSFQRTFCWDDKQGSMSRVTSFINTLLDANSAGNINQVLLGNIILCATAQNTLYKVIDGAQRLNTLLLLLTAIHEITTDPGTKLAVETILYNSNSLSTQHELLIPIDNDEFQWTNKFPDYSNTTNQKLRAAKKTIKKLLLNKLKGSPAIDNFYNRILHIVQFNVSKEKDPLQENQAHKLFEVINSGMPLTEVDILRGKLCDYPINDINKFKELFKKSLYEKVTLRNKLFRISLSCYKQYATITSTNLVFPLLSNEAKIKEYFLSKEFSDKLAGSPNFVQHLCAVDNRISSFAFTPSAAARKTADALHMIEMAIPQTIKLSADELIEKNKLYDMYCSITSIASIGSASEINGVYPEVLYNLIHSTTGSDVIKYIRKAFRIYYNSTSINTAVFQNVINLKYNKCKDKNSIKYILSLIESYLVDSDPGKSKATLPTINSNTSLDHIISQASFISDDIHNIGNIVLLESALNFSKGAAGIANQIYQKSSFSLTRNSLYHNNSLNQFSSYDLHCKSKIKSFDVIKNPLLIPSRADHLRLLFTEALTHYLK